ncbi:hypothetical protein H4Q26_012526 [Puccinia striiformis f. sp. tritici PST-130]|nr:hypothetical protein H4Q26_012526 [Puccinia striiformis f. sp. tritici PST-130]
MDILRLPISSVFHPVLNLCPICLIGIQIYQQRIIIIDFICFHHARSWLENLQSPFSGSFSPQIPTAATPDIFDYIVVGGGTAGMAVASRLSEDPALTVLVLEAGGTGANNTGIGIPGLAGSTRGTEIDWKYSTVPQSGANQRQYPIRQEKYLADHQL